MKRNRNALPYLPIAVLACTALTAWSQQADPAQQATAPPSKPQPLPSQPMTIALDPMAKNVLMASNAKLTGSLKEQWPGQAARFWVEGWTSDEETFTWTVRVPTAGDYSVSMIEVNCGRILIDCKLAPPPPVPVEIANASGKIDVTIPYRKASLTNEWARLELPSTLHLPAGESTITLRALAPANAHFNLALYSVELVRPEAAKVLAEEAQKLRSSTTWMTDAKYGLMFTWTAATFPQHGARKPYQQAVQDFDVKAFADMVAGTGAGFIVFATSWSEYYFPAPIATIERLMPGRTAKRDLIAELADALNARGIKLMIYYHAGRAEPGWWSGDFVRTMDKAAYFREWEDTIREISLRYGDKLAGYWFDDGFTFYYPMQAPWEEMTEATKAGNKARVVGYNSWIFPKATDFQDFACGEGGFADRMTADGELPVGGSGIFSTGPQQGLQATLTTTNEPGNWGHTSPDTPIPAPGIKTPEMIADMREAISRKIVPVINFEVYEDGTASPATIEEFRAIKAAIKPEKVAPEK